MEISVKHTVGHWAYLDIDIQKSGKPIFVSTAAHKLPDRYVELLLGVKLMLMTAFGRSGSTSPVLRPQKEQCSTSSSRSD